MGHSPESVPNPRLASLPSRVSDPDGVLSKAHKEKITALLDKGMPSKIEMGVVVVKALHKKIDIADFARKIVDRWRIGDKQRNDGALYVLATEQRKHHLFAGKGLSWDLNYTVRDEILQSAVDLLRESKFDAAVLKIVENVAIRVKWQRRLRIILYLLASIGLAGLLVSFIRRRRFAKRKSLFEKQKAKLEEAQSKMQQMDSSAQMDAPCCVCIEPLLPDESQLRSAAEIPAEDWQLDARYPDGGAVAATHGVELFKCGHVLHHDCASQALAVKNACPLCRFEDPRFGAAAVSTIAAAAVAARNRTFNPSEWYSSADFFYEDVLEEESRRSRMTRSTGQGWGTSSQYLISNDTGWGGGSSTGGAGTSGSW
eukprot:TRINITY_DN109443_c0_g1_i1.p1 TRINITY_DN109443_c0_g1~~TRINITY_DN109443_c0_g1_i1.p1  ORF type:complete len:370 (+),score=63.06 TRINITY_DN109443_c0_g1_i1:87-1196(+)